MKQPESNPLRTELARSQQPGTHPDADLLSSFAEGSLLPRERESVLAHLALCLRCREVLSTATNAAPELVAEAERKSQPKLQLEPLLRPARLPLRSWLPWVAAAACVLVAGSAVLFHMQNAPAGAAPSVESARMAHPETLQAPQAATQTPPLEEKSVPHKITPGRAENSTDTTAGAGRLPAVRTREQRAEATPPQVEVANSSGQAVVGSAVSSAPEPEVAGPQASGPAVGLKKYQANSEEVAGAKAAQPASEAAEVQGESGEQSSDAFSEGASVPTMRKALTASAARPHWRINDIGQLERALGASAWQAVPMPDASKSKLHAVSVFGSEVWAGGENSRLDHSSDNGETWESIKLPARNGYEHTITRIRFQSAQVGEIDSDDGTSWITTDGGRTWK